MQPNEYGNIITVLRINSQDKEWQSKLDKIRIPTEQEFGEMQHNECD